METTISIDAEFLQYWAQLTPNEKTSLLSVAKNYVQLKEEAGPISIEQYNKEIDEAVARVEAGEFFTMEEVKKMSEEW